MQITTLNHSDRYSLEQIATLFFLPDEEGKITSVYDADKKAVITEAEIGEKRVREEYPADIADAKEFKNAVKKSAFLALKMLSGAKTPWGILTGIRPAKFFLNLLNEHSVAESERILSEEYWVSDEKIRLCSSVAQKEAKILSGVGKNDVGIYIGIPFCPTRCAYCSFITEASGVYAKHIEEYEEALEKEVIAMAKAVRDNGFSVNSFYIGGGTPPALGEKLLGKLIVKTQEAFLPSDDAEFTVEAGRPDVIGKSLLKMLAERNVGRICINPQTMNDETLKRIGRRHSAEDTKRAFALAREAGFDNINSDIITGLPGETNEMFAHTLEEIRELSPEELTVHTMYLKRASRIRKEGALSDPGEAEKMVLLSGEFAKEEGYEPYYMYKQRNTVGNLENTGYAKSGKESVYNVCIMEETNTVLACGAGASTKLVGKSIERIYNTKDVLAYIKEIDAIIKNKAEKIAVSNI